MEDKLLTAKDVSEMLGCSERHVKKLLKLEELHGKKVANKWVILRSAVDEFVKGKK